MSIVQPIAGPLCAAVRRRSRARELLEVAVAYSLLEGALWTYGVRQWRWAVAALLWVTATTLASRRSARDLGITAAGWGASLWLVAGAAVTAGALLLGAWLHGTLHPMSGARTPLWHTTEYAAWALEQEFLAQSYIFLRLESALGSGRSAVICTAALFSAAHIPNPVLIPMTFLLGWVLCWTFARFRNLYTVAAAHALLGLALAIAGPPHFLHRMHVGIAYWM